MEFCGLLRRNFENFVKHCLQRIRNYSPTCKFSQSNILMYFFLQPEFLLGSPGLLQDWCGDSVTR